jgi:8-oxo-dGTP pyrophosphatase MutT (NUDIX family)
MLEASDKIEPVFPAATIVLLRDGKEGLEALLVQRSSAVKHMGGMWVFPGGKVDEEDYPEGHNEYAAAINAAIRETQEEAGLSINAGQLVYLSHWTTPEGAKKRFATWFFLAILNDDQDVQVDGGEIANHRWLPPQVALAESEDEEHELRLMPPTFVSLADIAEYACCAEARAGIGAREAIIYEPRMVFVEDGICFLYAGDVAYDDEEEDLDADGPRHRCYMIDGKLDYDRTIMPHELVKGD